MMLNDKQIRKLSEEGMITPFVNSSKDLLQGLSFLDKPTSFKTLSYGLGSFGYDVRLADTVKVFTPINVDVIDPKRPNERALVTLDVHTSESGERWVVLPPNSYALGHTVETFDIPRDISVIALGKSTYARNMIILNVTPIEAGFKGQVVIELANAASVPCKVYINEGIGQFQFFRGEPCEVSYGDRNGKYQHQTGIELGKC